MLGNLILIEKIHFKLFKREFQLFKDYLSSMQSQIKNRTALIKTCSEMYAELIPPNDDSDENDKYSRMKIAFAKHAKAAIVKEFGIDGSELKNCSENEAKEKIKRVLSHVNSYASQNKTGTLGDYSPWLKNFKRNPAKDLEIPGQYTGKQKPILEYHVKIDSFDERVSPFNKNKNIIKDNFNIFILDFDIKFNASTEIDNNSRKR